jgi:ribosomal protein S18 acetylase RimI-like enzyme
MYARRMGHGFPECIRLRVEEYDDALEVADAHIASWLASAERATDTLPSTGEWAARRRSQIAKLGYCCTLLAEIGPRIVGHITWTRAGDPFLEHGRIWSCYVRPEYWAGGVADRLMWAVLDDAGCADIDLLVGRLNQRARRFYERYEFFEVADLRDDDYVRYLRVLNNS